MTGFYKHFIALISLAGLFLISFHSFGQSDKNNIDSIRAGVQKLSSDTAKVSILLDAVSGIPCEDSSKKLLLALDAKRLSENINWDKGVFKSNRVIGQIYLQCERNKDKAFEYFQMNVDYAIKNKDISGQARALWNIAKNYSNLHEQLKAIEYYNRILALQQLEITMRSAVLGDIGFTYSHIGDYVHALVYYDSAIKVINLKKALDRSDSSAIAYIRVDIGELDLANQNAEKALGEFRSVLNLGNRLSDKKMITKGLSGVGQAYRMQKDYQHAIENYQHALRECRESNDFAEEVSIKDEIAATYLETWQLPMAQAYADSALSLAESQHYINLMSRANATMGNVYLKENKNDVAISYLVKALEIAKQTNNLEDQRYAYQLLDVAYRTEGKWQEAYNAAASFKAIGDTLHNIEQLNEITKREIREQYNNRIMVDSIKTHIEFTQRIQRQRAYTYAGFVAVVLVLLLAFFVYRNYVTQKKYNELLAMEKKRHLAHIEAQSNILSDIADTQAHKIRGPISTILGLVHIFNYDDPADPMNKQVMEWITSTTEKLDAAVKDVIIRENKLRSEHDESEIENS